MPTSASGAETETGTGDSVKLSDSAALGGATGSLASSSVAGSLSDSLGIPLGVDEAQAPEISEKFVDVDVELSLEACSAEVKEVVATAPDAKVECADITAPMDWKSPDDGRSISVHVTRFGEADKPVLFTNPGGPGGVGDALALAVPSSFPDLMSKYQTIAVDVRGAGGSTPLECAPRESEVTDYRTLDGAELDAERAHAAEFAAQCLQANPEILENISTFNTAADHELVRRVLGGEPAAWFGLSAASRLVATHSALFPEAVTSAVIDSGSGLSGPWTETLDEQPRSFQQRFDEQFVPWLARNNEEFGLGDSAEDVDAEIERIREALGDGALAPITPENLDHFLMQSLPVDGALPTAGEMLAALATLADGGPESGREALLEGISSVLVSAPLAADSTGAVNTAIRCNDDPTRRTDEQAYMLGQRAGVAYPLAGYRKVVDPCAHWPVPPATSAVSPSRMTADVLFLHSELDPSVAYSDVVPNHELIEGSRLVSVDNGGNHGVMLGANPCADYAGLSHLMGVAVEVAPQSLCEAKPLPNEDTVFPVGEVLPGEAFPVPATDAQARLQLQRHSAGASFAEAAKDAAARQIRDAAALDATAGIR